MSTEQKLNDAAGVPTIVVPVITDEEKPEKSGFFSKKKKEKKPKQKKNIKSEKKEKKPKVRVPNQTISMLPFVRYEGNHIVLKNGVMDILQITTTDLNTLNESDEMLMIYQRVRFMRSYAYDYKEVSLNFPSNTSIQQEYWRKKEKKRKILLITNILIVNYLN
ncbi:hypothetical protein DJ87_5208 [Bacillus cereus]|nr:hypothetical protein DJ87_5208 [Bacillus cereus]